MKPRQLSIEPLAIPISNTSDGAVRVTGTRIGIALLLAYFNRGNSPEGIVARFPTLKLHDVYAIIAYYLNNRERMDAWLAEQERHAEAVRKEVESQPGYWEKRDLFLARVREKLPRSSGDDEA